MSSRRDRSPRRGERDHRRDAGGDYERGNRRDSRRSPSPRLSRRRGGSKERERDRDREHYHDRERDRDLYRVRRSSRSRSPRRRDRLSDYHNSSESSRRVVVSSPPENTVPKSTSGATMPKLIEEEPIEGKTEEEIAMSQLMGFSGFQTTHQKHVPGNETYVVNISKKRKYRQYMNRRGGFNRPLDFVA